MKTFIASLTCAAVVIVTGSPQVRAQSAASGDPVTLADATSRALAHAPRVAEARAREMAAHQATLSRATLSRPVLSTLAGFVRTNHVNEFGLQQSNGQVGVLFPDIPNNYRVRAELSAPLSSGGRVDALVAAAKSEEDAAMFDRVNVEQDIKLDVARAYRALVTATEAVAVLERTDVRTAAWLGDVQARFDVGLLPPSDVLTAQAQRARQTVQLIQARNAAASARVELARWMGVSPDAPLVAASVVDQPIGQAVDLSGRPVEALVAMAREARPERASLVRREAALRSGGRATAASRKPQVAGLLAVEPQRPNNRWAPRSDLWRSSWDLGITVNWTVYDGGRSRADEAVAVAQAEAAGHRIEEFDRAVEVEIRQRLLDLSSGRAAIDASQTGIAAALEARRVLGERFTAGVATSTDVLDADVALRESELERTRLAAALRVAEARLLRALGAL